MSSSDSLLCGQERLNDSTLYVLGPEWNSGILRWNTFNQNSTESKVNKAFSCNSPWKSRSMQRKIHPHIQNSRGLCLHFVCMYFPYCTSLPILRLSNISVSLGVFFNSDNASHRSNISALDLTRSIRHSSIIWLAAIKWEHPNNDEMWVSHNSLSNSCTVSK